MFLNGCEGRAHVEYEGLSERRWYLAPTLARSRICFPDGAQVRTHKASSMKRSRYELTPSRAAGGELVDLAAVARKRSRNAHRARFRAKDLQRHVLCRCEFWITQDVALPAAKVTARWIVGSGSCFGSSLAHDAGCAVKKVAPSMGGSIFRRGISPSLRRRTDFLLMKDPPSAPSLGRLCLQKGYTFQRDAGRAPTLSRPKGTVL